MIAYMLYFACMSLLMGVAAFAVGTPVHKKKQAQHPEEATKHEIKSTGPDAT